MALFAAGGHLAVELVSNFLPIIYPILVQRAGLSFAQVGTVALVATLGVTVPQPLFGMLTPRLGAARMVVFAVLWTGLLYGLIGFVDRYGWLLVVAALGGLGSALFHPAGAIIASGATRRRGASMSIFSVGGNVGAASSPLLVALAITLFDLRGTAIMVPVALGAAAVLWLTVGRKLAASDRAAGRNAVGLDASAGPAGGHGASDPDGGSTESAGAKVAAKRHRYASASVVALGLVVVFAMARAWYQVSLTTYVPLWLSSAGLTPGATTALTGQVLFALVGSLPAGSLIGGALSDRLGRWQVLLAAALLLVPAHLALLAVGGAIATGTTAAGATSLLPLLALIAVTGALIGATYPVAIIMAQSAWPRNLGLAGGLVMGVGWLPGGVGASATGLLADAAGLEQALATLLAPLVVGIVAIAGYALLHARRHRRRALLAP